MVKPVVLVAPYRGMADRAREVCRDFDRLISIEEGDLQVGLDRARDLVNRGAEVVISRGGTAKLLRSHLSVPVVEVKVTAYDLLEALQKVSGRARRIGIVGFENVIHGAEKLARLLELNLVVFPLEEEEDVPARLDAARDARVDAIIGDNVVVSHATERGLATALIESGFESILQSFEEALGILDAVHAEAEKSRRHLRTLNQLRAVLDSVDEQMVILDSENRVLSCNPSALKLLRKHAEEVEGRPLSYFPLRPLAELRERGAPVRNHLATVQGTHVLLDYMPIESSGEPIGTLLVGRNVSNIEQAERTVRSELYDKGHVARYGFGDLITEDDGFRSTIERARSFASSSSTVLIIGETGTGKEVFAQSIHNEQGGDRRPFVAINCATLPEPLLESELFGYAPGAFTGARSKRKKGYFELAHGGTLLLDEIGEMPLNLQSRLLRVIEERVVQPLGDDRVIPVTVHLIASTNRDLAVEVHERRFRADLFYRLNVLQLTIPPLRARGGDALVLFRHFVTQINPECDGKRFFSERVGKVLRDYSWPGNVRELRNLVERLATLTAGFTTISGEVSEWLEAELRLSERQLEPETVEMESEEVNLKQLEKAWVRKLCESSSLTQDEVAKLLGVSRTTLWKIRKGR